MKQGFIAEGTTCDSCRQAVIRQAKKVEGVTAATFDLRTETGTVTFDENIADIDQILDSIEEKGFKCYILDGKKKDYGWVFAAAGAILIGFFLFQLSDRFSMPQITENMGYGLLFLLGLLTGFHCIGMCGGFMLSYKATVRNHAAYGISKTLSYTVIGAFFGLIGSVLAFTPTMRGIAGILAGLFLLLFGLRQLNVPFLRGFYIRAPKLGAHSSGKGPVAIGLLNGLMIACGPLQALYIMAAGTGSMVEGAKLMLVFALGTLPVMMGFGLVTAKVTGLSSKIGKVSGTIVLILGLLMIKNGLALTGVSAAPTGEVIESVVDEGFQEIHMDVTSAGWEPASFVLKPGIPVRWVINGKQINGCNNAIVVPEYGLDFDIVPGEQVIEFTPDREGIVKWSCWMGMIPGQFIVEDDAEQAAQMQAKQPVASSGGCGCSH